MRQNEIFSSEDEKLQSKLIKNPVTTEQAYAYFGLMLGTFPLMALFGRFIFESDLRADESWVILLLLFVNIVTAVVGFISGKLVGNIVKELEKISWNRMILAIPFIGLIWGTITGGFGGVFLFIIGAVFGAMIGGFIGSLAVPIFTIFHRIFKRGDKIDSKLFLPIAFGITCVISAVILGY